MKSAYIISFTIDTYQMTQPSTFSIIKTGFMGVTGLGYTVILPILIGAIVDQLNLDRSMVGWITSSNIGGLALGGMMATLLIGKIRLLHLIRFACIGLIIFDFASAYCSSANALISIRFVSGLCGGILYASSLASFSALKNSIRAFSIYIICYAFISGVTLFVLPFFITKYGFQIGFYTLTAMALISFLCSGVITKFESGLQAKDFSSLLSLVKNKYVLLSLVSYFLVQLAGGVAYTYTERIAKEAGQPVEFVGLTLSLGAFLSVAGAFLVIKIGNRIKVKWTMSIAMLLMTASMVMLFRSEYALFFLIGSSFMGFFWSILIPYFQQMQGHYDVLGRIVTIGTVVNMSGRAVGPAIAAAFLGAQAYENVLWLSISALALSLVLIIPVFQSNKS